MNQKAGTNQTPNLLGQWCWDCIVLQPPKIQETAIAYKLPSLWYCQSTPSRLRQCRTLIHQDWYLYKTATYRQTYGKNAIGRQGAGSNSPTNQVTLGPLVARREACNRFSLESSEGTKSTHILILDSWIPDQVHFYCCKPLCFRYFILTVLGNHYKCQTENMSVKGALEEGWGGQAGAWVRQFQYYDSLFKLWFSLWKQPNH